MIAARLAGRTPRRPFADQRCDYCDRPITSYVAVQFCDERCRRFFRDYAGTFTVPKVPFRARWAKVGAKHVHTASFGLSNRRGASVGTAPWEDRWGKALKQHLEADGAALDYLEARLQLASPCPSITPILERVERLCRCGTDGYCDACGRGGVE